MWFICEKKRENEWTDKRLAVLVKELYLEWAGQFETVYLRLGLETHLAGLEAGQNPQHLVSEPNEGQVLDVPSQKEFSERQSDR